MMTSQSTTAKHRIFLSHSRQDKWVCHQIREKIEQAGGSVWVDVFDIDAGRNISEEIKAGLRKSDELLVLLSPASIQSDWVKREAGIADALDLPITLVMMHAKLEDRPKPLQDRRAISINELPDYFDAMGATTESV
ncbi:toll/interleukin-1 receptor domain-containing protein [Novipirellula caenicola]|uniref:TIR domain-containing protein n=1 Tax=Novipirellula caenicola TaxID=1536901 RepID=A0ABP9VPP0_9BACT